MPLRKGGSILVAAAVLSAQLASGWRVAPLAPSPRQTLSASRQRRRTGVVAQATDKTAKSVAFDESLLDGSKVRIGIISTRWNPTVVGALKDAATATLTELGVKEENVFETQVPGSWELPSAARFLALSGRVDAILCLGCLVKGDTMHFEYIAQAVSSGLMSVQLQTSVPCTFGVLTTLTEEQAALRSYADGADNHGVSWAKTAVEMALLRQSALGMDKKTNVALGFATDDASANGKPGKVGEKKIYF